MHLGAQGFVKVRVGFAVPESHLTPPDAQREDLGVLDALGALSGGHDTPLADCPALAAAFPAGVRLALAWLARVPDVAPGLPLLLAPLATAGTIRQALIGCEVGLSVSSTAGDDRRQKGSGKQSSCHWFTCSAVRWQARRRLVRLSARAARTCA